MRILKKIVIILIIIAILVVGGLFASRHTANTTSAKKPTQTSSNSTAHTVNGFNKSQYSLSDPASLWIVVSKQRPLTPTNYAPKDLVTPNVPLRVPGNESMQVRTDTAAALEALFAGAKAAGVPLMLSSGYRSYAYQTSLYNGYVAAHGQAQADTFSARPGYSEHQTGWAADVEPLNQQCDVDQCFANLPEGKWVAAHAYEYGFIVRYTADKVGVTGYSYEPWHIRYVGKPLALELHQKGIETLEEFFGLPAVSGYAQ